MARYKAYEVLRNEAYTVRRRQVAVPFSKGPSRESGRRWGHEMQTL